ncbi:cobalt ABC transporter [Salipiger pallidus]|uniref:Cobalt ABC transporter n=1 Tax=Salipiger pallidus TaxID=1775170 RepID=A0A8J3EIA8_9RHOB|nr:ABC transporter ATP-binding protein [Salipiger pallidus]GGG84621.1 cobalt ABC transporter [Salipiger pallidus]
MTNSTDTAPLLALSGVTYETDGLRRLGPVDLTVTERRVGVIGRNGSGKSTLSRLVCGLVAPTHGTLRVAGKDVARDRRAALRRVGMLFQNPDHQIIFPTVGEEITFGLRNLGRSRAEAEAEARAALADYGCAEWYDRTTGALSQGQRHLVCLIAVMAMRPRLVILDEPFAGLDLVATRFLDRQLALAGPSLLHVSHDLQALTRYDRVIWIDEGRVRLDGPAADVIDAYRTAMEAVDADAALSL